ncbi:MAG: cytochrome c oxidase subunit 3 [Egibacteraceae bacterium]
MAAKPQAAPASPETVEEVSERYGVARGKGRPKGWWGIIVLLMNEALLFSLLLFVYYYLSTRSPKWPPGDIKPPELVVSGIRSVLLWLSSATLIWGERGIRKGRQWRLQLGLIATIVLAGVFLAGHVQEMIKLPKEFTWQTNAYGSVFYTITNFHAAHLAVGITLLVFAFFAARRGRYTASSHLSLTTIGIYWHFVDVVWAFVFPSLYLYPHLMR